MEANPAVTSTNELVHKFSFTGKINPQKYPAAALVNTEAGQTVDLSDPVQGAIVRNIREVDNKQVVLVSLARLLCHFSCVTLTLSS